VRNTAPLSHDKRSSYTLELRADDCGGRSSDIALLTINVKPVCQPRWTGENLSEYSLVIPWQCWLYWL